MTRTEFEAFLARFLWRDGDDSFQADLPLIIRMGEARLGRDLIVLRRVTANVLHVIDNFANYPPDYHSLRALSDDNGPLHYVTPDTWAIRRAANACRTYTLNGDGFMFTNSGFTPDNPGFFALSYYATLPEYADQETWVQTHYFDLYLYACLIHTAPYLQGDERVELWTGMYNTLLATALEDDKARSFNGSPLVSVLPGRVA